MRKAGVLDYESLAKDSLAFIKDKPISFEVFSDEPEMKRQALKIRDWQQKIPITNSRGESSIPLIKELAQERARLNVTAILTLKQVREVSGA
jgi:transaldolase